VKVVFVLRRGLPRVDVGFAGQPGGHLRFRGLSRRSVGRSADGPRDMGMDDVSKGFSAALRSSRWYSKKWFRVTSCSTRHSNVSNPPGDPAYYWSGLWRRKNGLCQPAMRPSSRS
jgi:hypothetical protein